MSILVVGNDCVDYDTVGDVVVDYDIAVAVVVDYDIVVVVAVDYDIVVVAVDYDIVVVVVVDYDIVVVVVVDYDIAVVAAVQNKSSRDVLEKSHNCKRLGNPALSRRMEKKYEKGDLCQIPCLKQHTMDSLAIMVG